MKALRVLVLLIGLGLIMLLLGQLGYRFNLSTSLPLGVYCVTSESPSPGSIVHVCLPRVAAEFARRRGYLGPGSCPGNVRPLGKLVIATEGDMVELGHDGLRVNGEIIRNSRTVSRDGRGRDLPHYPWGEHHLRSGELWLFSPYHRNAYDSRYFGPVRKTDVLTVLRPLWTTDDRAGALMNEPTAHDDPMDSMLREVAVRPTTQLLRLWCRDLPPPGA